MRGGGNICAMTSYPAEGSEPALGPDAAPPDEAGLPPQTTTGDDLQAPHTRTSAVWTSAAAGAFLLLLMLIFIFQNGADVPLTFLWIHATLPLGAALLLASVIGALTVVLIGAGRLLQLRLMARRHRQADH
jgi:uncharacterized integral membrane protein